MFRPVLRLIVPWTDGSSLCLITQNFWILSAIAIGSYEEEILLHWKDDFSFSTVVDSTSKMCMQLLQTVLYKMNPSHSNSISAPYLLIRN